MINNKLKNCCNDCVYCEIVTETKRRAIPERGAEWKIEVYAVQDARIQYLTEGLCTALRITARD